MSHSCRQSGFAVIVLLFITQWNVSSCRHEPSPVPAAERPDNFPADISRIIKTNCATAGCHNAASYQFSGGGLLMDSWEQLFEGGAHGAAIVPYRPEHSPLLLFTNSYPDLGPVLPDSSSMKMPMNRSPLSREDYLTLRNWVAAGAPDNNGNIPFASNPANRQKIYMTHQGCDFVMVVDAEKMVVMRIIPIGMEPTIESAHSLVASADGYVYVGLWASQYIAKIDTRTDSVVEHINFGSPNNNMLLPSPDGKELFITNWFSNALIRLNTATSQTVASYGSGSFVSPHGIAHNRSFDTFYVTELSGNIVYKIPLSGAFTKVSIDGNPPSPTNGAYGPHNIMMAPDYSKYFVTCEESNEVRVLNAKTDALLDVINVGKRPQEMAISKDASTPYLFVACLEESSAQPLRKGSVYIINYKTHEIVQRIADRYYMPHAIAVDDRAGMLYVVSRNIDPDGPVPHHNSSVCDGRSGFYSIYNFRTLQPVNNRRYEVTVDPYSADVRFK